MNFLSNFSSTTHWLIKTIWKPERLGLLSDLAELLDTNHLVAATRRSMAWWHGQRMSTAQKGAQKTSRVGGNITNGQKERSSRKGTWFYIKTYQNQIMYIQTKRNPSMSKLYIKQTEWSLESKLNKPMKLFWAAPGLLLTAWPTATTRRAVLEPVRAEFGHPCLDMLHVHEFMYVFHMFVWCLYGWFMYGFCVYSYIFIVKICTDRESMWVSFPTSTQQLNHFKNGRFGGENWELLVAMNPPTPRCLGRPQSPTVDPNDCTIWCNLANVELVTSRTPIKLKQNQKSKLLTFEPIYPKKKNLNHPIKMKRPKSMDYQTAMRYLNRPQRQRLRDVQWTWQKWSQANGEQIILNRFSYGCLNADLAAWPMAIQKCWGTRIPEAHRGCGSPVSESLASWLRSLAFELNIRRVPVMCWDAPHHQDRFLSAC